MKNILKKVFLYLILLVILAWFIIFSINYYVLSFSSKNYFKDVNSLPKKEIWLVFWASVKWWKPSLILKDRLDVAFEAYKTEKIEKIIVSWDNSVANYNEPRVMKNYLVSLWVDENDIYEDFAWFDTYDSIYRVRDIFKAEKVVLFTQDFHLKRALYIAEKLWVEAYWVPTDLRKYSKSRYNYYREIFARIKAFLEVEIIKSKPKFLWESIKIVSNEELNQIKEELKWEELEEFLKNFSWSFEKDFE